MQNKKYRLPEREWYSLSQAVTKIKTLTDEEIDEKDLIYYASKGYIELAVYLSFEFHPFNGLIFSLSNRKDFINNQTHSLQCIAFSSDDEITTHKGKYAEFSFNDLIIQEKEQETRYENVNGIRKLLSSNIYRMKGFFAVDFVDFNKLVLNEKNISISSYDALFRFCRSEKYTNDLGITLRVFDNELKDSLCLKADDIFITNEEILNFLEGKTINSLNTVDSFIKEWNEPTRYEQVANGNNQKTQQEKERQAPPQRNKGGRPQNPLKNEVVRIAKSTFEHYHGNITRVELASRIADYIQDKYKEDISEETVKKYLTEQKIGNRKGQEKKFKIIDTL